MATRSWRGRLSTTPLALLAALGCTTDDRVVTPPDRTMRIEGVSPEVGDPPAAAAGAANGAPPAAPPEAVPPEAVPPGTMADASALLDVSLRVSLGGDGFGEVTLSAPGVVARTCASDCQISVPVGTTVIVAATPRQYSRGDGWSEASCFINDTCSVRVTAALTLQARFQLLYNVAFTSSRVYTLDQLPRPGAAANAECARLAAAAGVHGTRWVAWLAAEGPLADPADDVLPTQFLQSPGGWVRRDGVPVARSRSALLAGEILNPLSLDERGAPAESLAWSGASRDGTLSTLGDCNDWTNPNGTAAVNLSGGVGFSWSGSTITPCIGSGAIECFGDDAADPVPSLPAGGRRAFVTAAPFAPGGGITAADAQCQREACAARLALSSDACSADLGQPSFLSYLHTPAQPAWQRFDLTGPGWVRPDGIEWLSPASQLEGDAVGRFTALNVRADGTFQPDAAGCWVGRPNGEDSCSGWSSSTGQGLLASQGDAVAGTPLSGPRAFTVDCSMSSPVFCLEQ